MSTNREMGYQIMVHPYSEMLLSHTKGYVLMHATTCMNLKAFIWSKTKHRRIHMAWNFIKLSEKEPPVTEGRSEVGGGVLITKRQEGWVSGLPGSWSWSWFAGTHSCELIGCTLTVDSLYCM